MKNNLTIYVSILILLVTLSLFSSNFVDLTGHVVGDLILKEKAFEVNQHFSETGV